MWIAIAASLAGACGGDIDCRNKERECAGGFECREAGADGWQCRPSETPAPGAVGAAPPEGVLCMGHPMCAGKPAAKCFCGPDGFLSTRFLGDEKTGKPIEKAVYENDGSGRPVQVVVDVGMDGSADSQHAYRYNARGDPVRWEIRRLSKESEGARDQVATYVYDAQGSLVEERKDVGIDGAIDSTCVYSPPCPPPFPNPGCKPVCE